MTFFLLEVSIIEFGESKACRKELLFRCLRHLTFASLKFHLKHKWRSRLLQPFVHGCIKRGCIVNKKKQRFSLSTLW
ncbi:hypothetical protein CARUB_v10024451mg [Capsella rubella]|uniref:Uncharacterized protein n=1 Tax=Capsella rubella TaxID=81985 RepID=R0FYV9_9BRAS|nr:hypothetical protein CARUB_v10024451mg [Capsella rubella]EOA28257.1 hypothetical protein CARUB_v10024451mg [Capsella rubella]